MEEVNDKVKWHELCRVRERGRVASRVSCLI